VLLQEKSSKARTLFAVKETKQRAELSDVAFVSKNRSDTFFLKVGTTYTTTGRYNPEDHTIYIFTSIRRYYASKALLAKFTAVRTSNLNTHYEFFSI
jgi:hypothetical protein